MFTYVFLNKKEIFASVINISQLTTILSSVALVFLLFFQHYEKNNASRSYPQKKNIIMIVMDGLSTEFLQPYNPLADITEFKEISQDSILYTHMHTNFPTTQNFFKILYYGNKSKATKGKNLLSTLQENGITVRWSTFYNGGLPDSNKIKYKGLRSAFLTQNFTGLAHLLGLDYNIFRYWTSRRGKPMGPREIKLCVLTNKFFKKKDAFQVHLIEEIERLRNDRRPFFFVFHILPQAETSDEEQGPWRTPSGNTDLDKIIAKIQEEQDYSYPLEQAWAVDEMRKNYAQGVKRGIKKLKQFYDTFKKRGWGEDTLLIITADHGQKFSKGKVWYSFHHEEEVTRVPLIIYYKDVKGTDERLAETIDITQTILDYFGIRERFSDNAQSLLGSYREKIVTSLMKDSKKRKEQFLSVYKDGYKYVFNIYPQGKFLTQKCKIEGFDTIPVEEGEIVLEKLDFSLKDILAEYGIKR